jgi:circadian clock protein KaiC
LKRIATNVPGLDLVLNAGLERGGVVVVAGPPGSGKTILAQQICFANATAQHRCVYFTTMSEPHGKLVRHLEQFSFFDPELLGPRVEHIHLGDLLRHAEKDGLRPLISEIVRKTLDEEPAIVVIDSAKMLRDFADERELRSALYEMTGRLSHTETVLLLLGEYTPDELASDVEFSLADGIVQLEYEAREPVDRRWLRIVKMRGGSHRPGKHTFRIGPSGIEVFPRIETLIPAQVTPVAGRVSSGIPGLDELMNGGAKRGDATLVMGPSGVGKTTLGLRWLAQELEQGQRCLYVTFQDTADQLISMAAAFGWDLGATCASGQLAISHVPMGDLDLDVMANGIRTRLAAHPISRIVIDSLAELVFAAREWERFPAYMRSLIGLIRAAGTSSLVTSETTLHGLSAQSLEGLMFLFENCVNLVYIEEGSQVGRALTIGKMRTSPHGRSLHSFDITDRGLVVGDRIEGVTGRLGWSALRTPEPPHPAAPAPAAPAPAPAARTGPGAARPCLSPVPSGPRVRLGQGAGHQHPGQVLPVAAAGVDVLRRAGPVGGTRGRLGHRGAAGQRPLHGGRPHRGGRHADQGDRVALHRDPDDGPVDGPLGELLERPAGRGRLGDPDLGEQFAGLQRGLEQAEEEVSGRDLALS